MTLALIAAASLLGLLPGAFLWFWGARKTRHLEEVLKVLPELQAKRAQEEQNLKDLEAKVSDLSKAYVDMKQRNADLQRQNPRPNQRVPHPDSLLAYLTFRRDPP